MGETARLSESQEDYLEAIFHIEEAKQAARAKDISDRLGVTRASVTGALKALADKSLVNYSPYDLITLTPAGRKAARDVVRRHVAMHEFFVKVLQIDEEEAEHSACRMEHALSPHILERFVDFVAYVDQSPESLKEWKAAPQGRKGRS
jgi:DtxR family Mn-dependent transcriptional regulator